MKFSRKTSFEKCSQKKSVFSEKKYCSDINFDFSEADFLVGGLHSNNYTQRYFLPSMPYDEDDLTWCVQRMEPHSFWLQVWYVSTKTIWILCYMTAFIISIVILLLMSFRRDQFGYLNFDLKLQDIPLPVMPNFFPNTLYRRSETILKMPRSFLCIFCIVMTSVVWNFTLIKIITSSNRSHQVQSVNEIIEHNYRLIGGSFANLSVSENAKVKNSTQLREEKTIFIKI